MKIAAMSDRPDLEGKVPEFYKGSPYLLIIEADEEIEQDELLKTYQAGPGQDVRWAREIINWDCEAVLCGPLEQEPFTIIAEEGYVTRFLAAGLPIREALAKMRANCLENIRDYIGGTGCHGH